MSAREVPSTFEVELRMLSDWHVGAGYGEGVVDRAVLRDVYGLPYVPGKTLRGVLRDSCEDIATALDEGLRGSWQSLLDEIFGDQPALQGSPADRAPMRGRLRVSNACYPAAVRSAVSGQPGLVGAATFVKPGVRVSARSGRAVPRHLRFDEMARTGARLRATLALELPDGPDGSRSRAMFALLLAALTRLEAVGGKRRRGAGRVEARIVDPEGVILDNWLDELDREDVPEAKLEPEAYGEAPGEVAGGWMVVRCALRAESGVCASAGVVGNVNTTLDRVPGSMLLPAILGRLRGLGVDLRSAVAVGDIAVTDATPMIEGLESLPVPQCLAYEKSGGGLESGGKVFNLLANDEVDGQPRFYRSGFVAVPGDAPESVRYCRTPISATTHNTIDDDLQRPSASVGGVYTLEAIAPGTRLAFEVRVRGDIAAALEEKRGDWWRLLDGQWSLGSAKAGGYGLCSVSASANPPEVPRAAEAVSRSLTIWLLSDALLRDDRLRPTTDPGAVAAEVGRLLGAELRVLRVFGRQNRTESWQRSWGLPRPSLLGLAAGTCLECELDAEPDPARLRELERAGIGERRAEGFGRIALNHPLLAMRMSDRTGGSPAKNEAASPIAQVARSDEHAHEVARTIEVAAWRTEIAGRSLVLADDPEGRKRALGLAIEKGVSVPELSQVASLREALGSVTSESGSVFALGWLEHLGAVRNRAEKWPVGAIPTVKRLLVEPSRVWELLDVDGWAAGLAVTEGGREELAESLWAEAVRAVADAVCRGHKRAVEQGRAGRNGGAS